MSNVLYGEAVLPSAIRSRLIDNANDCLTHILEAGFETPNRPLVLLIHGFPELAFSWRKQLVALAEAGYHAVAPDQRGYGRSSGTDVDFDDDLLPYTTFNRVADMLGLVHALGHGSAAAVIGHDYGSPVAAWCALLRPEVFRSLVMMSAPFAGPPDLASPASGQATKGDNDVHADLAALPRPRKHYQWYYATRPANEAMWHCAQGMHDFLRAYYHFKSADHKDNQPFALKSWSAAELEKMPTYYVMDLDRDMAQTVAPHIPSATAIATCPWLTEDDLRVYSSEYGRTGFQGGLQSYRIGTDIRFQAGLKALAGRTIDVPASFIGGASDWGPRQRPGALERMNTACTRLLGIHRVEGAGHWVQQEQADKVNSLLLEFLRLQPAA